jgi:hypothetical protein
MPKSDQKFSKKEAAQRFVAALRGARIPKPENKPAKKKRR